MTEIINNPFDDWTEDKKCFRHFAETIGGSSIHYNSPEACKWCAGGYLGFKGIPLYIRMKFSAFLFDRYYGSTADLNDIMKWKPQEFKKAWDEFIESSMK